MSGATYCNQCVCLSVCLRNHTSKQPNFLHMLPVAISRFCSGEAAIYHAFLVLWMRSCFDIMGHKHNDIGTNWFLWFGQVHQMVAPVSGSSMQSGFFGDRPPKSAICDWFVDIMTRPLKPRPQYIYFYFYTVTLRTENNLLEVTWSTVWRHTVWRHYNTVKCHAVTLG